MLLEIRKMSIESIDLDEAVSALALLKATRAEYDAQTLPVPEWVDERLTELQAELKSRRRDYLSAALKRAKMKRDALKSRDERARDAEAEVQALEKALAQ